MAIRFDDQVVIVTGSGNGLGKSGKARCANDSAYAAIAGFAHIKIPDSSLLWTDIIPNNARESRYTRLCRRYEKCLRCQKKN